MLLLRKQSVAAFYAEHMVSLKQPPAPPGIEVIDGRRNINKLLAFKGKLQIPSPFHY